MVVNCGAHERAMILLSQHANAVYVWSAARAIQDGHRLNEEQTRVQLQNFISKLDAQIVANNDPAGFNADTDVTDLAEVIWEYSDQHHPSDDITTQAGRWAVLRSVRTRIQQIHDTQQPLPPADMAQLVSLLEYVYSELLRRYQAENPPRPCTIVG